MKKNKTEVTNKMVFDYLLRGIISRTIFFFTRYYPFSTFYKDSIYHYDNKLLSRYERAIIVNLKKAGFPKALYAPEYSDDSPIVTYFLFFFKDSYEKVLKNKDMLLKGIAKDFGVSEDTLYFNVTQKEQTWKLQIASEFIFKK